MENLSNLREEESMDIPSLTRLIQHLIHACSDALEELAHI